MFLSAKDLDQIQTVLLSAFGSSLNEHAENYQLSPSIVYTHIPGVSPGALSVYQGCLLMNIPEPFGVPEDRSLTDISVVIFNESLDTSPCWFQKLGVTLSIHANANSDEATGMQYTEAECVGFERFATCLKGAGVEMVLCQKLIHPYLQQLLTQMGIYTLQRISTKFIAALQAITGARVLGGILSFIHEHSHLDASVLGYIGNLHIEYIYNTPYVIVRACSDSEKRKVSPKHLSTVLVTAYSESHCSELQRAYECAIRNLSCLLIDSTVLVGSGCWQAYLASKLASQLDTLRLSRTAVKATLLFIATLRSTSYELIGLNETELEDGGMGGFIHSNSTEHGYVESVFHNPLGIQAKVQGNGRNRLIIAAERLEPTICCVQAMRLIESIVTTLLDVDGVQTTCK